MELTGASRHHDDDKSTSPQMLGSERTGPRGSRVQNHADDEVCSCWGGGEAPPATVRARIAIADVKFRAGVSTI